MTQGGAEPSEPIGKRPDFQEWADEVMSETEARQRASEEASAMSAARHQRSAERGRAMTRRLLSWFSGNRA
jgi:hypothetical protein